MKGLCSFPDLSLTKVRPRFSESWVLILLVQSISIFKWLIQLCLGSSNTEIIMEIIPVPRRREHFGSQSLVKYRLGEYIRTSVLCHISVTCSLPFFYFNPASWWFWDLSYCCSENPKELKTKSCDSTGRAYTLYLKDKLQRGMLSVLFYVRNNRNAPK